MVSETIKACLQCGACAHVCNAGVEVDAIIRETRALGGAKSSPPWWLKSIFANPKAVEQAASFASRHPYAAGLGLRLLGAQFGQEAQKMADFLAKEPFLSSQDVEIKGNKNGPTVLFFVGCIQNLCFTEAAKAILELLLAGGFQVFLPRNQGCCGMALFSAGAFAEAKKAAAHNLQIIMKQRPDFIVTGCATCASMISKWGELFGDDDPLKQAAVDFGKKVYEFSAFIRDHLDVDAVKRASWSEGKRVAYHLPCHQKYGLKQEKSSPQLLAKAFGEDFVEMDQGCCGQGGLFGLGHPKESHVLAERRVESAEDVRASLVVTTCSGCLLQWKMAIKKENAGLKACHLAEVLNW